MEWESTMRRRYLTTAALAGTLGSLLLLGLGGADAGGVRYLTILAQGDMRGEIAPCG
jgi:hypothetical protein